MEGIGSTRYQTYIKLLRNTWENREDIQAYIGLLLTLTAVSFFVWFAIRPTVETILELFHQIQTQKQTVARLEQKTQALRQAQNQWERIQVDLPAIEQALPDKAQAQSAARQIEGLAKQQAISLVALSGSKIMILGESKDQMQPEKLPDNLLGFPISLTAEGDPERILNFLTEIGNLRRPLVWDTLSVSGKPPATATELTISISGLVPFTKP